MIHGVSFGNQDLASLVAEPPANSASNPAAAGMYGPEADTFEKKGSVGKTVVKTLIAAGVIAGILAALRGKVEMFKNIDLGAGIKGQEGIMNKAKFVIAKAGDMVINAYKAVASRIPFLNKTKDEAAS